MHATTNRLHRTMRRVPGHAFALIKRAAFWIAAILPFSYPLLFVGIEHAALDPDLAAPLLVANAGALLLGHRYEPSSREAPRSDREVVR